MSVKKYRWLQVLGLIVIASMLLGFVGPQVASAQEAPRKSFTVGLQPQGRNDTLPSLANVKIKSFGPEYADRTDLPVIERPGSLEIPRPNSGKTSEFVFPAAEKKVYDDAPALGLDNVWQGINQGANRMLFGFGVYPPDTNGDVSRKFYVQTVNTVMSVWSLTELNESAQPKMVWGPAPINSVFSNFGGACEFTNDGDPIVLFDENADRWLVSQFALPYLDYAENPFEYPFYQCTAISATNDPTGAWYRYEHPFPVMNDYPKYGIWNDGYYMSINQFGGPNLNWKGQGMVVFNRDAMLAGQPADWFYFDAWTEGDCEGANSIFELCWLGAMLPGTVSGEMPPASASNVFMMMDDDAWGSAPVDQLQYWEFDPNWATGTATITMLPPLDVNPFVADFCPAGRNCIRQPGTSVGLAALNDRLMYKLQYRTFSDHESMVVNHTVGAATNVGMIRWYELRRDASSAGLWYVYQQGDYAPDSTSRWMGSIAMDKMGNMLLGYSVSDGTSVYPGIRYTGRKAADPLGTMTLNETVVWAGGGVQTGNAYRWGDYSTMSVSPDGCEFYYTQQYNRVTSPVEWYTAIGQTHFDNCVPTKDTVGVFRPGNGAVYLKLANTSGFADMSLAYGLPGDQPIIGDWNGDDLDTLGVYRNGFFFLRNSNTPGFAERVVQFGMPGDQPVAGDWDGDGVATIGVYRSSNWTFYLRNSNTSGPADVVFSLGLVGDVAIAGDWDGDGYDSLGVFRPSNGALYLKNDLTTGIADVQINYGLPGDKPVTGDWDSDGIDTIGVFRNGTFFLRNSNTIGFADFTFGLGDAADMPLAGNWDALPWR